MSPNDARKTPKDEKLLFMNTKENEYIQKFKLLNRDNFKKQDKVFIKTHSLQAQEKITDLFNEEGKVIEELENNSYLVNRLKDGKLLKKSHSQLMRKF